MPAIGQSINVSLFQDSKISGCECLAYQIIDDSILISEDSPDTPCDAHRHGDRMMQLGVFNGLIEAADKREYASGEQCLLFAGKSVSIKGVAHPLDNWLSATFWFLNMIHKGTLDEHSKKVFLGRANWLICHQPLARPFLNVLHPGHQLKCECPFVRYHIYVVLALAVLPRSTDYAMMLHTPTNVLTDLARPYVFCDASHKDGMVGIILQTPSFCKGIRYVIPAVFRADQQAAELYGCLLALRLAVIFKFVNPVLVGDNTGALYSLVSLKGPTRRWWRLALLQSLSRFYLLNGRVLGYVAVRWICGTKMPADVLSRNFSLVIGKIFSWFPVNGKILKLIEELPDPPDVKTSRPPVSVWQQPQSNDACC